MQFVGNSANMNGLGCICYIRMGTWVPPHHISENTDITNE